jgi:hypothetical protein
MGKDEMESTNKLLKVIIALLLRKVEDDTLKLRDQIKILYNLEMKPSEIAEILGRSNIYVSKELSLIRKLKKAKE